MKLTPENMLSSRVSKPQNSDGIDIDKIFNNSKQNYNNHISNILPQQPSYSRTKHFEKMDQRGKYDVPNRQHFVTKLKSPYSDPNKVDYIMEGVVDRQYSNCAQNTHNMKRGDNVVAVLWDLVEMQQVAHKTSSRV